MTLKRYALVTGAAGDIGLEVAKRLSRSGYTILASDRNTELSEKAAAEIGGGAIAVPCDLASSKSVADLEQRIAHEWNNELELCFLNAGLIIPGEVANSSVEDLELQIDVMLVSAARLARAAVRSFGPRNRGHLIATVSEGAIIAMPGSAAYSAAKAGLRAYLTALRHELRKTNVAVSGIYPSAVNTDMLRHEAAHGGSLLNFVGKISTVDDVADAVEQAIRTKRLEVYVPYMDSLLCRTLQFLPWITSALLPLGERLGERGRRRFIALNPAR